MNIHHQDCIFCRINQKQIPADIVFESDTLLAFRDHKPKAPVHLLVIPHQHFDSLAEMTDNEHLLLGQLLTTLPQIAKQQGLDTGFRTVLNTGPGGGQEVFHVHFHLLGGSQPLPGF